MKFYISDLHFSHKNALSFDNRPFFTVSEMNETLINNWNSVVTANGDIVSIIGVLILLIGIIVGIYMV